jgi:excinuclease ABC subunit A
MKRRFIHLHGVWQNNLQGFDLKLPLYQVIAITGVSGSGKSSLAVDTLYAEGQRRYVETFSPYARQFLERMPRPRVERIDHIPPAIAIEQTNPVKSSRSTLGTLTEINHFTKLLFFREARLFCPGCGREVAVASPVSAAREILGRSNGKMAVITTTVKVKTDYPFLRDGLISAGFFRVWDGTTIRDINEIVDRSELEVVIDRLAPGEVNESRVADSVETGFLLGGGRVSVRLAEEEILHYSSRYSCAFCQKDFKRPTPNLFSFNSPVGACPECRGFGRVIDVDWDLVVPNPRRSIREGAVRVFHVPAAQAEREEMFRFCRKANIPIDVPWQDLPEKSRDAIRFGEGAWYGVKGFFDWLETKRYKSHVRIFLSRFRAYLRCPLCHGTRFAGDALNYRLGGLHIGDLYGLPLKDGLSFFNDLSGRPLDQASTLLLQEVRRRLAYLCEVGLEYLSLDRQSRTLSGGEVARAMLTRALGSSLVETLYILDEPSRGLHARDTHRVVRILKDLSNQRNTVCVVEHDPGVIESSDFVVDLGPGPGEQGGRLLHAGPFEKMPSNTPTGEIFSGGGVSAQPWWIKPPRPLGEFIRIRGAQENNLKKIHVKIPIGALTVVTGVSGSGKSTLVETILYRGALREKGLPSERPGVYTSMKGLGSIGEVVLMDQSPVGRTPRATPASYLKIYDGIRQVLAQTEDARSRGFGPSTFSFNTPGGRCEVCGGQGFEKVEMQFLSDLFLPCPACRGERFRPEVLEVRYRSKDISEILRLTLSEAASFFEGHEAIAGKLSGPIDMGLGYLRLGQPIHTLSGGEAQRLKLVRSLFTEPKTHALILMDEPTVGLHMKDIEQLNRALHRLVDRGNTVVVVEHNFEVLRQADWVIDLGPEGGEGGGDLVYQGPLPGLLPNQRSITAGWFGRYHAKGVRESMGERPQPGPVGEEAPEEIRVLGARHHNLKNLSLDIPRNRFVVVTGLSGSGKSSLAFDIIFTEGQRRYVESLPTYVRQFLRLYERPEVDLVLGLPPTIAIEQRTSQAGPRSTVATLTEVYHFLRLLYAKLAMPFCPSCGNPLATQGLDEMVRQTMGAFRGHRMLVLAPKIRRRKGFHRTILAAAAKKGYGSARIDGKVVPLPSVPELSRYREHTIEWVVGEIKATPANGAEIRRLIERALEEGGQEAVLLSRAKEIFLSQKYRCGRCGIGLPVPDPLLFSFNSPAGACARCGGLGRRGSGLCQACNGTRLRPESLAYRVSGKHLGEVCGLSVASALEFIQGLEWEGTRGRIAGPILSECVKRLSFLRDLGLGYLTLDRAGDTLSGGEAQRIRLSSELGSNLTGVCYVLDEPTIGLHPRDNALLVKALKVLKKRGNTVIVVEHDEETLRAADWVIDLGPGGGERGGEVLCQGPPSRVLRSARSLTGSALRDRDRYRITSRLRADTPASWLNVQGAHERNLKDADVSVPLSTLTVITGVSGSGKSTLLMDVLYPNLSNRLNGSRLRLKGCSKIAGAKTIKRVLVVDHSPIGRTPRSTPATYIGIMDEVRQLMAGLPESRARGWLPGRFSFNVTGGRCQACQGQGTLRVEMRFLPEVYVPCESCGGGRYHEETLSVKYRGKDISEILEMTFSEARDFFSAVPHLRRALEVVCDLGLGYLGLGQPSPSLSGGEAQRIKLAEEFVKGGSGGTLFFLDEPTTGLHPVDIRRLLDLFHRLVERGDTVIAIEHNLDIVKEADWVIDLGPEGGEGGGEVLFQGSPEGLLSLSDSHTGRFLKGFLNRSL